MRLVVIGGVAAGLSAASRARRIDPHLEIVVLEKGPAVSYTACGLPYYIEGQVKSLDELIVYRAEKFETERNIRIRTGAEVVTISHPRRQVLLRGGEQIGYDRLIISTGARFDRGAVAGMDESHAFTIQTLEDAHRLRSFIEARQPRSAAIIGGGYIGLEMAGALRAHGMAVTVYEASSNLLGREDAGLKEVLQDHLRRFRIRVEYGRPVHAVGDLKADLVILAAGLKPNVDLAVDAGAEIGRTGALQVDEHMGTNLHGVYAAGDCAEARSVLLGRPVWFPLGSTANKMGRVAGACAAGRRERFPGIAHTSIVRVCGLAVGASGLSCSEARREGFDAVSAVIVARDRARYFWFSRPARVELTADRRTGRMLGGSVVGDNEIAGRTGVIAAAVTKGMKVSEFAMLDLAYSPPYAPVWDPLLVAAQQLEKLLD
jgi:NADPH-dependent 2,4-dienoyl-CoA reductase/sulfur reductase-like enzyme